jgi:hypothetical protein
MQIFKRRAALFEKFSNILSAEAKVSIFDFGKELKVTTDVSNSMVRV